MTTWKIPVESPVSLRLDGSGSNAAALAAEPPSPKTVVAASLSHSIRLRVSDSAPSLS